MRRFVLGDVHGNYRGLKQCLKRSGFDDERDLLVSLGDLCDRNIGTKEVFNELLKIKNFKMAIGNHDQWMLEWSETGNIPVDWMYNGGYQTVCSYNFREPPKRHVELLSKAVSLIKIDDKIFVHAGIDANKSLEDQSECFVTWDRTFLERIQKIHKKEPGKRFFDFESVFIGHTPTLVMDADVPQRFCNVWCMDTGSGFWPGRLTIMDIDTKEYWQSDHTWELYAV